MNPEPTLFHDFRFRLPADGWVHIAPLGRFDHPSGLQQIVDREALEAMASAFREEAAAPNFPGLLVDFDHFSHDGEKPSEAAGWITELEARDDGLWARVRWSDVGEAAVRGGRYRLVSPVWNGSDCQFWHEETSATKTTGEAATITCARPRRLDRVALTNDPNLTGLVPLTNNKVTGNGFQVTGSATCERKQMSLLNRNPKPVNSHQKPDTNNMNYRTELLSLLGLAETAADSEIAEAITALRERLQQLEDETRDLRETQADADLDEFAEVIGNRDAVRDALLANRTDTRRLLSALRRPAPRRPLHNRANTRVPAAAAEISAGPGDTDQRSARRIANRARELQRQLGLGHTQAFNLARGEEERA